MIDKFCDFLLEKIRKEIPEMSEEKADVIYYGLQNLVGEVPKMVILLGLAYFLGILKLTILSFLIILPYRIASGGFHLKSHLGCMVGTSLIYYGNVFLSQIIQFEPIFVKYVVIIFVWLFGIRMISLYAPADTENVPILSKKERKKKKIASYIILTTFVILAIFIKDTLYSNMILFGMFMQTLTITPIAYRITRNKYGYEVYSKQSC